MFISFNLMLLDVYPTYEDYKRMIKIVKGNARK